MLSSVANYLFGSSTVEESVGVTENVKEGSSVAETQTDQHDLELTVSPADLDWELVDRVGGTVQDMEVSPLENLLIEHPSMSVYHKKSNKNEEVKSSKQHPASARSKGKANKKQLSVQKAQPPCHPKAVAERAGLIIQVQSHKTSQRQKQKSEAKQNTKKAIQRQNRAKEFKALGKHRNCTDKKMNKSGRMNIRAC